MLTNTKTHSIDKTKHDDSLNLWIGVCEQPVILGYVPANESISWCKTNLNKIFAFWSRQMTLWILAMDQTPLFQFHHLRQICSSRWHMLVNDFFQFHSILQSLGSALVTNSETFSDIFREFVACYRTRKYFTRTLRTANSTLASNARTKVHFIAINYVIDVHMALHLCSLHAGSVLTNWTLQIITLLLPSQ